MDPISEVSKYGGPYAVIAVLLSAVGYLFRKLMTSKDEQIRQAREDHEKEIIARETLQRTADNIILLLKNK